MRAERAALSLAFVRDLERQVEGSSLVSATGGDGGPRFVRTVCDFEDARCVAFNSTGGHDSFEGEWGAGLADGAEGVGRGGLAGDTD